MHSVPSVQMIRGSKVLTPCTCCMALRAAPHEAYMCIFSDKILSKENKKGESRYPAPGDIIPLFQFIISALNIFFVFISVVLSFVRKYNFK